MNNKKCWNTDGWVLPQVQVMILLHVKKTKNKTACVNTQPRLYLIICSVRRCYVLAWSSTYNLRSVFVNWQNEWVEKKPPQITVFWSRLNQTKSTCEVVRLSKIKVFIIRATPPDNGFESRSTPACLQINWTETGQNVLAIVCCCCLWHHRSIRNGPTLTI